ncbi:MAG: hypothetical protein ACLFV5_04675 [Anaerolineales bacterium]
MSTEESLRESRHLIFARRVMGRVGLFDAVQRSTEGGERLRQKYMLLTRFEPLSVRRWEPLARQFSLKERQADGEDLVLVSVPGRWSQKAEGGAVRPEPLKAPPREPRERVESRAANMRAAIQRARAFAEGRRESVQGARRRPISPAIRRMENERGAGEESLIRRGSRLVEEPDKEQTVGSGLPESFHSSSIVEEAGTYRQRAGAPIEPEELVEEEPLVEESEEGSEAQEMAEGTDAPLTESPGRETPAALAARSERTVTAFGEEVPFGSEEEAESSPTDVLEPRIEEPSGVSSELVSREAEKGIPRRGVSSDREEVGPLKDAGASAFTEGEIVRGEGESEPSVGEVYTQLGATSYGGNLRREMAYRPTSRGVSREHAEERSPISGSPERVLEGREEGGIAAPVRWRREAGPTGDTREEKAEMRSPAETPLATSDSLPLLRTEGSEDLERGPVRVKGEVSEAEKIPDADAMRREPSGVDATGRTDHRLEDEAVVSSEGIVLSKDAATPRSPAMSQERDAEEVDVGEGMPGEIKDSGLQDVPLEEALFGASRALYRADRSSRGEREAGDGISPLPFPDVARSGRGDVFPNLVRQTDAEQVPAGAAPKVKSAETEASDLGEAEERVDVDRLADEVYRRIRNRLRVERERYGTRGRW